MMHTIRKSDLKRFPTRSEDVCRIENGSSNAYLREDRVIEKFLKAVEPKYNASLKKVRARQLDEESIFCLAGFVSYVVTCSPTAMRLGIPSLKAVVETTAEMMDKAGKMPLAPASLGGKSMSELIADGTVEIQVDAKYPQAIGIGNILDLVSTFGNSTWEILHNSEPENPFFTSDFPAAIERPNINAPINRIVPLAPDVAIRIRPRIPKEKSQHDFKFAEFECVHRRVQGEQIRVVNRQIVRCAEDLVFYRDQLPWMERFVKRHRDFWIDTKVNSIRSQTGVYQLSHTYIARRG